MSKFPAPEVDDGPHRSQERRDLHPDDMALRRHGFSLWARPRQGQPVWRRNGKLFTQAEALALVQRAFDELRELWEATS